MGMKPRSRLKAIKKCHSCGAELPSGFLWCTVRCRDNNQLKKEKEAEGACYTFWDPKVRCWVSVSPELDLISQGATELEATTALADSITLWLVESYELGSLDDAMKHRLECVKKRRSYNTDDQ